MAYSPGRGSQGSLPNPRFSNNPPLATQVAPVAMAGRSFSNCVADSFLPQFPAPETSFDTPHPSHSAWTSPHFAALSPTHNSC